MKRAWSFLLSLGGSVLLLALMVLARMVLQPAQAAEYPTYGSEQAIGSALAYIEGKQTDDGGIEGFTPGQSDTFVTMRAAIAVGLAGRSLDSVETNGNTMIDYLEMVAISYTHEYTTFTYPSPPPERFNPGRGGQLLTAVAAGNEDATNFGGLNIIESLEQSYDEQSGAYGTPNLMNQPWAIIGLSAAGEPVPPAATQFLLDHQNPDGSWDFGYGASADSVAIVMVALLGSGNVSPSDPAIQQALHYLHEQQLPGGGWGTRDWNTGEMVFSSDTTAWGIQALAAAGYTPATASWADRSPITQGNPRGALLTGQNPDGSFGQYPNALSAAHGLYGLVEHPITAIGHKARASRALAWLHTLQQADGGWADPFGPVGATADAVLAFAAADFDPNTVTTSGGASAVAYLEANARDYVMLPGSPPTFFADRIGKLMLAVVAAGKDPRDFGPDQLDLVAMLTAPPVYHSGAYTNTENTLQQAYPILVLAAAGEPIYTSAVSQLISLQQDDGGWKYDLADSPWNTTSPDNTALALQALAAARPHQTDPTIVASLDASMSNAVAYLHATQDPHGGWGSAFNTAYAIQGLLAAGENLHAPTWTKDGHSPYDALMSYQDSDGPFSGWTGDDDRMSTAVAVPALLSKPFPLSVTASLRSYPHIGPYADADRTVAAQPYALWTDRAEDSGKVIVPFGSDMNGNGNAVIKWAPIHGGTWVSSTLTRNSGTYTASITLPSTMSYRLRATFMDPDGVQSGAGMAGSASVEGFLGVAETLIRPAVSRMPTQTLRYAPDGTRATEMVFPTGQFTQVTTMLYTPEPDPTLPLPDTMAATGWGFHLHAASGGRLHHGMMVATPYTVTIHYSDEDVADRVNDRVNEESLSLFYLDGSTWHDATTTCSPASSYERNPEENWLRVPVCRVGEFALGRKQDVVGEVASVTLSPDALLTIGAGDTTTITATVAADDGIALAGQPVTFIVTGTSTLAPTSGTSDSSGQVVATLTGATGLTEIAARSGPVASSNTVTVQVLEQEKAAKLAAPPVAGKPGDEPLSVSGDSDKGGYLTGGTVTIPDGLTTTGGNPVAISRVVVSVLVEPTTSWDEGSAAVATVLIDLYDAEGNLVSGSLNAPIEVVLTFTGIPEGYLAETITVRYRDGNTWSSEGITITSTDPSDFRFTTTHASEFLVSVADSLRVYLPLVQR